MSTARTLRRKDFYHNRTMNDSHDVPAAESRRPMSWRKYAGASILLAVLGGVAAGFLTRHAWMPNAGPWMAAVWTGASPSDHDHGDDLDHDHDDGPGEAGDGDADHAGHDHGDAVDAEHDHEEPSGAAHENAAADEAGLLELSRQAEKNIGLKLATVAPRPFERTVTVPATVVNRPGRTEVAVSAPMTGIVTRLYPIQGEAVAPGDPLFDLRLTHEDLVEKQAALLRSVEELDVVQREVARLEQVTASGAVAGKRLLERQYDQQRIEAAVRAERQGLRLHGLSEEQIRSIVEGRRLLESLTIAAPPVGDCPSCAGHDEFFQVTRLEVKPGEHVTAGTLLGVLADHCELLVEGKAFEQDAAALHKAAADGIPVTALVDDNGAGKHEVPGLVILYVENEVERDSRALKFYVRLPNEQVRNGTTPDGHRFIGWRYKPGQRVSLLVPVERWADRIVLPVEAVVREGAESFVYPREDGRYHRCPVHVEYRDQRWAVIERDGALAPGDVVATAGAYQIHLAIKNKAGGGPDPHAGHHH